MCGDGLRFALTRFVDAGYSALKSRLRRHDQPALGHTIVTQHDVLRAGGIVETLPRIPRERLRDHLRDQLERMGNACDKAEVFEIGGIGLVVQFAVCY